ncbi:hypothetical protein KKD62_00805 [Patescibacteria group bacterium]|nr:hypothetical protein [Patescibacteria group bacterium]MBU1931474.1 hypothetical protein [Patescibacteria group bacterium]
MAKKKAKKKLSWDKKLFAWVILLVGIFTILAIVSVISQSTEMRKYAAERSRMAAVNKCEYFQNSCRGCIVTGCRFCTDLNSDKTVCAGEDRALIATYKCTTDVNMCTEAKPEPYEIPISPIPTIAVSATPIPRVSTPVKKPLRYDPSGIWNWFRSWLK